MAYIKVVEIYVLKCCTMKKNLGAINEVCACHELVIRMKNVSKEARNLYFSFDLK